MYTTTKDRHEAAVRLAPRGTAIPEMAFDAMSSRKARHLL